MKKKQFTKLILFSGGVDSTYLLAHALRETNDTILVHHVHMINRERRHLAEAKACKKIVEYCRRNYRDFLYTESTVDRSSLEVFGYDVITVASEAGIAASNFYAATGRMPDFWMYGINSEEADLLPSEVKQSGAGEADVDVTITSPESRLNYILAAMAASCFPNQPPKYLQPVPQPKAELMKYMGGELTSLCWTCRRPIKRSEEYEECGECQTCILMNEIRTSAF